MIRAEEETLALKPMNCPGHVQIFKQGQKSYRDLPLRMAVTTIIRDTFLAGGVNTEMELPLYQGFAAANLTSPQLRIELPIGSSPEFRSLLYDLLLAVWARAEAHRLPLDTLGDPTTLALRLEEELDTGKAFASFVALIGAFARKRAQ